MSDFIFYPGKNNILLIAPHGRPEDDINTGELTKKLAERLDCYAAINEKFRKPDKESEEVTNADLHIADLNNKKSITEAGLMADWFEEIEISKKAILDDIQEEGIVGTCYIFLIHGAKDENVEAVSHGADVLLGIGRSKDESGVKKDRPTTTEDNLKNFIEALKNEGSIEAVEAKAAQKDTDDKENWYAGHDKYNLNQCFVERPNGVLDPKIQSFQVEIKNSSFRDNDESIKNTASRLAAAIGKLTGVLPIVEVEEADDIGKEVILIPEQEKPVLPPEIIEAADKIIEIFQNSLASGLIEVGDMLLKEFYNNDFAAVRNRDKSKDDPSILQIHREIETRGVTSVSKSWLYNAIYVAADSKYIESRKDFFDFHTYGSLPASHKVLLERVKDDAKRKAFIVEYGNKKYSFIDLKNMIRGEGNLPSSSKQVTLLKAANNPAKLFSGDYDSLLDPNKLKAMRQSSRTKLKGEITSAIEKQEEYLEKYRKLIEKLNAIPEVKKQKKGKKKVG